MEIMKKILSKDWHCREEGFKDVLTELEKGSNSAIMGNVEKERLFAACFGIVAMGAEDRLAQVSM